MSTTAGELRACIERLLAGDFVTLESPVYLISRDEETLRPIVLMEPRTTRTRLRGKPHVWSHTFVIQGTAEREEPTVRLADLVDKLAEAKEEAIVKILCDGFGLAHWDFLQSVKLAPEIIKLRHLDFAETWVILCP